MKFLLLAPFLGLSAALPASCGSQSQPSTTKAVNNSGTQASAAKAASSSSTLAVVAPPNQVTTINDNDGVGAGKNTYVSYSGNGTTAAGWPSKSQWASFSNMFSANTNNMVNACGWNSWKSHNGTQAPNTSQNELTLIRNAIEQIAAQSYVDHRFILAIILQESEGCVRVPTTKNANYNPGLMQSHQGAGNCNDNYNLNNDNYLMSSPCPQNEIQLMIQDGTQGTSTGPGLAGLINTAASQGATNAAVIYRASRLYNSGSVCGNDLSNACGATASYASDVANRLTGWVP